MLSSRRGNEDDGAPGKTPFAGMAKACAVADRASGGTGRIKDGKLLQIVAGVTGLAGLRHILAGRGLGRSGSGRSIRRSCRLRLVSDGLCRPGSSLGARSGGSGRGVGLGFGGSGSRFGFPLAAINFVDSGGRSKTAEQAQRQYTIQFHADSPVQSPSYLAQAFLVRKSTLIKFSINFTERQSLRPTVLRQMALTGRRVWFLYQTLRLIVTAQPLA